MRFFKLSFPVLALTTAVVAAPTAINTTQEFKIVTAVKPGQGDKSAFDGLYLTSYHSGAGMSDATFVPTSNNSVKAFLNTTTSLGPVSAAPATYPLEFDLGNDFPWSAVVANVNFYSAWEPVRINGGGYSTGDGAYYINGTGVQWTTSPGNTRESDGFGGWLVCTWWHDVPQLFARVAYYHQPAPCNCADVWLCPEYV